MDFALPYMKVALGVVSPDGAVITNVDELNGKTLIVSKGTTAETYFTENHPGVKLLEIRYLRLKRSTRCSTAAATRSRQWITPRCSRGRLRIRDLRWASNHSEASIRSHPQFRKGNTTVKDLH